jgi:hypothetical protein
MWGLRRVSRVGVREAAGWLLGYRKVRCRRAGQPKHFWGGLPLWVCFWQGWTILALAFHGGQVASQAADGLGFPFCFPFPDYRSKLMRCGMEAGAAPLGLSDFGWRDGPSHRLLTGLACVAPPALWIASGALD